MDIENAKKRLLDSGQELSYSQRVAIVDLIERLDSEGWISVDDRLPAETQDEWCETYICYLQKENGEDFVTPLMSNGKLFLDESTKLDLTKYVTHWQPLPKAPEAI